MILPGNAEIECIRRPIGKNTMSWMRKSAAMSAMSRGENAPRVYWGTENAFNYGNAWSISIVKNHDCHTSFFHEQAHLISLLDSGVLGREIDAEAYALGMWLAWNKESIPDGAWRHAKNNYMRSVLWIAEYAADAVSKK